VAGLSKTARTIYALPVKQNYYMKELNYLQIRMLNPKTLKMLKRGKTYKQLAKDIGISLSMLRDRFREIKNRH